ncbi:hypothetical protein [Lacipirellula sp.]|uniref:hypothetical protein n=1 Tax=Lacipirellula sp. TaxID=2691419 RepID=UPI003D140819
MLLARSGWRLPLLLAAVAFSTGCIRETTEGTAHVFQNELWVPIVTFLGGIAACVGGWFVKSHSERFGWAMIILGPIAAIGFAPSLYLDRAAVDDSGFSLRAGIWGMTAVHDVKYDSLRQIHLTKEESYGRRGKKVSYYMVCDRTSGEPAKISLGNQCAEAAAPLFLDAAQARGIPITNETGE